MKNIETQYKLKVEFYDLDPMNVVWHGNYLKYLEAARCDMLEKIGYTYDDMKKDGFAYPVAKMELKYIKPCTFSQELVVTSTILEVEPALSIKYVIRDAVTDKKVFVAKSLQICLNYKTMETVYKAPEGFLAGLEKYGK